MESVAWRYGVRVAGWGKERGYHGRLRPTCVQFVNTVAPAAQHGHDTWFDSMEPAAQKNPALRRENRASQRYES